MVRPPKMPKWLERKIKGQMQRKRRLERAVARAIETDKAREALSLSRELQEVVDSIGVDVHQALAIDGSKQAASVLPAMRRTMERFHGDFS